MGFIEKTLAIIMLPLGFIVIFEALGLFTAPLPFQEAFVGAILMIVLQIFTMFMAKKHQGEFGVITLLRSIILMLPGIAYIISDLFGVVSHESVPVILGVIMIVEAFYALH